MPAFRVLRGLLRKHKIMLQAPHSKHIGFGTKNLEQVLCVLYRMRHQISFGVILQQINGQRGAGFFC